MPRVSGVSDVIGSVQSSDSLPYSASSKRWRTPYDDFIKRYCVRYLGRHWDCLRYKAQLYQESKFDVMAVSPVGAEGIAQFMPDTIKELSEQLGMPNDPYHPQTAIHMGAIYVRRQYDQFTAPRSEEDRKLLAQAAYNCGLGCVLDAQRRAGGAAAYQRIAVYLPHETTQYNIYIKKWRKKMIDDGHVL